MPASGYGVDWVPSMRMIVDLDDFDASTWVNLTGASGHAFHPHYADQAPLWQRGETRAWPFTTTAVQDAATRHAPAEPGGLSRRAGPQRRRARVRAESSPAEPTAQAEGYRRVGSPT